MAFTLTRFASIRPYLYHLTSRRNFEHLLSCREMQSASELLVAAGEDQWLESKRGKTLAVVVDGRTIDIRDQAPLYEGNMLLEGGWTFGKVLRTLNEHVFFWPGWTHKPIDYGVRHFETYEEDAPIVMRLATNELFAANTNEPKFCKYNSGSPRMTYGRGAPRGPNTFVSCVNATFTASQAIEVVYAGSVILPTRIESSASPQGPWETH